MKPLVILLVISYGIFSRLIPHLSNFSPEIGFALYLGIKNNRLLMGLATILLMAIVSDVLLSFIHPWPAFGNWTFFTYSALLAIGWFGAAQRSSGYSMKFMMTAFGATLAYWIWTNLGTWLMSNIYPHTFSGFITCYLLALPFLSTAIAASIAWCAVIMICERTTNATCQYNIVSKLK